MSVLIMPQADATRDTHARIEEERKNALPDARLVQLYRRYYRGRQRGTLTAAQEQMLRGVLGNRYADNICRKIVNETANRLELLRFSVADKTVEEWLADFYIRNLLADISGEVHKATVRDGNHAVSLRWDNVAGRVAVHRERWWDGVSGTFVAYDDNGEPVYAVKDWKTPTGIERRVIWTESQIQRWVRNGDGWRRFFLPEDNNVWPIPWEKPDGSPLGIPVTHFANSADNDTMYGASELDGGPLGFQDEINDLQRDLTTSARMTAYQMLYATGVQEDKDTQGNVKSLKIAPGTVFSSENKDAAFGVLSAGDLSQIMAAIDKKKEAVAIMTDTPQHVITGGAWPSGLALMRAEQPLVAKIQTLAKSVGPSWSSVAHTATEIANVFGRANLNENALIVAVFASPEKPDKATQVATAAAEAPFVSREETWRNLGKTPEQITQLATEMDAAQQRDASHQLAAVQVQRQQLALAADTATGATGGNTEAAIAARLAAGSGATAPNGTNPNGR